MTQTRDGEQLLSNVIFGESCNRLPSVMRITAGDGPKSWRGRETQVCYATGKETDPVFCDWTVVQQAEFDKRFPLDQKRVERKSLLVPSSDNRIAATRMRFNLGSEMSKVSSSDAAGNPLTVHRLTPLDAAAYRTLMLQANRRHPGRIHLQCC